MKPLFTSIIVAGFIGLAMSAQAQDVNPSDQDSLYRATSIKDTALPPGVADSLRTHGFFITVTGGSALGPAGGLSTGPTIHLTMVFGKHVIDFDCEHLSAGSITTGVASTSFLNIFGSNGYSPAPTVPNETWSITEATYGQRFTPSIAWMVGFANVNRTKNTETTQVTAQPYNNFLGSSPGGTYWNYTTQQDSYYAIPISIIWFSRWTSWLGWQLKARVLFSPKEVSGNVGLSIGFGGFPRSTPE